MPKPSKGPRLGGSPAHERLLLANLATSLFEHGRIKTTEAKARRLRPVAEKLITKAKRGDLHNRRLVLRVIRDKSVVHTLFTEIAPRYESRPGGYTRITKIGPRRGDNAPMAVIELVARSEQDLLDIRNFGAKSIEEVKQKLNDMGLSLKDSPPGFDPTAAADNYDDDQSYAETEQY